MELASEKPRMFVAREFDNLDKLLIGRDATENQATLLQSLAIGRIEFVAMAMALADFVRAAVNLARERTLAQHARARAQTHRAAELLDPNQIAQLENDRMGCFQVELGRVGVLQIARAAGKLNAGCLHAQADSEVGRARPPR